MECRLFAAGSELADREMEAALHAFSPRPGAYRAAYPEASAARLYELAYSDWLFRMPSLHLAGAHAAAGGTMYLYELAYPAPGAPLGACHGLDVPLIFGSLRAGLGLMLFGDPAPAAARALGDQMRAAWAAFAACRSPGWPAYTPGQRLTRIFDDPLAVIPYPEETARRLWAGHRFAALDLAVGPR